MKDIFDLPTSGLTANDWKQIVSGTPTTSDFEPTPKATSQVEFTKKLIDVQNEGLKQQAKFAATLEQQANALNREAAREAKAAVKATAADTKALEKAVSGLPAIDPTAQVLPPDLNAAKQQTGFDMLPVAQQNTVLQNWRDQELRRRVTANPKVDIATHQAAIDAIAPDLIAPDKMQRSTLAALGDTALGVGQGIVGIAKTVPDLARAFTDGAVGADSSEFLGGVSKSLEERGSDKLKAQQLERQKRQAQIQADPTKSAGGKIAAELWDTVKDLNINDTGQIIGNVIPFILTGGLSSTVLAARVGREAITKGTAKAIQTGINVGQAGITTGGELAGGAREQVMNARIEDLRTSKAFQERKAANPALTDEAIREQLAQEASRTAGLIGIALGGLGGLGGAEAIFSGRAMGQATKGVGRKVATEVVQQGAEEGTGAYAQSKVAQQYDPTINPLAGVGAETALGALGGGVFAGGAAALPGEKAKPAGTTAALPGAPGSTPTATAAPVAQASAATIGGADLVQANGVWQYAAGATPNPTADAYIARRNGVGVAVAPTPVAPATPTAPTPVAPATPTAPTPVAPATPTAPTPVAPATPTAPTPAAPATPTATAPVAPATPTAPAPVTPTPVATAPVAEAQQNTEAAKVAAAGVARQLSALNNGADNIATPTVEQLATGVGLTVGDSAGAGQTWAKKARGKGSLDALAAAESELGPTVANSAKALREAFTEAGVSLPDVSPGGGKGALGWYQPSKHKIAINSVAGPKTILHEYLHALTVKGIIRTPEINRALFDVSKAIGAHPLVKEAFPKSTLYASTNGKELVAELFSPALLPLAARIRISELSLPADTLATIERLGLKPQNTVAQLLARATEAILKALGVTKVDKSILDFIQQAAGEAAYATGATYALQKQSPDGQVLRSERPQVGLQEDGQGNQEYQELAVAGEEEKVAQRNAQADAYAQLPLAERQQLLAERTAEGETLIASGTATSEELATINSDIAALAESVSMRAEGVREGSPVTRAAEYLYGIGHPATSAEQRRQVVQGFYAGTLPAGMQAAIETSGVGLTIEGSERNMAPWALAALRGDSSVLSLLASNPLDVGKGAAENARAVLRMFKEAGTAMPTIKMVDQVSGANAENVPAQYNPADHSIELTKNADVQTVVHEYLHAVTVAGLDAGTQEAKGLVSLLAHVRNLLNEQVKREGGEPLYAGQDKYELLAEMFTPRFMAVAGRTALVAPKAGSLAASTLVRIQADPKGTIAQMVDKIIQAFLKLAGVKTVDNNIADIMGHIAQRVNALQAVSDAPASVDTFDAPLAIAPSAMRAQANGRPTSAAMLTNIQAGVPATPTTLGGALNQAWAQRDMGQVRTLWGKTLDRISEQFHDSVSPARRWIAALPLKPGVADTIINRLYLAPGRRDNLLAQAMADHGGNAMTKALFEARKGTKHTSETVQQWVGFWLTAKHAAAKNQMLVDRDTKAHAEAQAALALGQSALSAAQAALGQSPDSVAAQQAVNQATSNFVTLHKAEQDALDKLIARTDAVNNPDLNAGLNAPHVRGVAGGMTNAQADAYIAAVEAQIPLDKIQAVAEAVYDLNAWRLTLDMEAGKAKPDVVAGFLGDPALVPLLQQLAIGPATDALRDQVRQAVRSDYVPMTGHPLSDIDGGEEGIMSTGVNMPNTAKDFSMDGRTEGVADDGITTTMASLIRSATFAGFADFTTAIGEAYDAMTQAERDAVGLHRLGNVNILTRMGDNVILDGRKQNKVGYAIADRRVLESIRKANMIDKAHLLERLTFGATRKFAYMATQANPIFAPKNMINDLIERSEVLRTRKYFDVNGNEIDANQAGGDTLRIARSGRPMKAIWMHLRGIPDNSAEGQGLRLLIESGGLSSYGEQFNRDRADLVKAIKSNSLVPRTMARFGKHIEKYNKLFDMVAPLSSYMALKQQGVSDVDAAGGALDLMNFRKTGTAMAVPRVLYAFAQPAVTGGANMIGALTTRRGRARYAAYLVAFTIMHAVAQGLGDDDEGGDILQQRPDYERETTLPWQIGDWVLKIPVGFGMTRLANNLASQIMDVNAGKDSAKQAVMDFVTSGIVPAITPLEEAKIPDPIQRALYTVAPTVFKPLAQVGFNVTGFGVPINNEKWIDHEKFRHLQGSKQTTQFYRDTAKALYDVFGVDRTPEDVKALVNGYAIGPFRVLLNEAVVNPDKRAKGSDTLPVGLALLNPLVSPMTGQGKTAQFFDVQKDLDELRKRVNAGEKLTDPEEKKNYRLVLAWDDTDEALKKKTAAVTRSLNKRQITESYADKRYAAIRMEREEARDKWLVKWRTAQGL